MPRKPQPAPTPEPTPAPSPSPSSKRYWPPPTLTSPVFRDVGGAGYGVDNIIDAAGKDLQLRFTAPVTRRLIVRNARNVRIIGGEINIDTEWTYQYTGQPVSPDDRWGLYFQGCTGVIDVEGLWVHGSKIIEGIDCGQWSTAPNQYPVALQVQSCRIEGLRDPAGAFHADCLQMWGGVGALRVYNATLESQFQCFMAKANENRLGSVDFRRVNMRGLDVQMAYMLNHQHGLNADAQLMCDAITYGGDGSLEQQVMARRPTSSKSGADFGHSNFGNICTPNVTNTSSNRAVLHMDAAGRKYLDWPTATGPTVAGRVWEQATEPDYVPAGSVGMTYQP